MSLKKFNKKYPYIIAEIGVNHEGNLSIAKKLIKLAKKGGADAVKFQTYKADTLTSKNSPAYWDTKVNKISNQHELFSKYDSFNEKEYQLLFAYCESVGIDFASTPFDEKSVDMLYPMLSYYKIASADITNFPLLRKVSKKRKPIILSTGASNKREISNALRELKKYGAKEVCLMHCILSYPTVDQDANLNMITDMKKSFPNISIGYSDHTRPDKNMVACTAAYLKGAMIIEKHFTHDKKLPGNDHFHAMDINDLKVLKYNLNILDSLEGKKSKNYLPAEKMARKHARRSIVINQDIKTGTKIKAKYLICKRPASGISPIYFDKVVGMTTKRDLKADEILKWSHIS